ncbi:hypothetical protein E4U17_003380 [Claviceps sp. LM77 group G4]|nr:hypothetical protein E4U17_003380 [Claviceps sp. LM77 group G4]KAG6072031.1 hypothetical protein E4U33_003396 [Claviceps sp. LM78 group G4]KAG6075704.1 hypothetical protein E4U16_003227 [Claviceps sp. LM84 group G4]
MPGSLTSQHEAEATGAGSWGLGAETIKGTSVSLLRASQPQDDDTPGRAVPEILRKQGLRGREDHDADIHCHKVRVK